MSLSRIEQSVGVAGGELEDVDASTLFKARSLNWPTLRANYRELIHAFDKYMSSARAEIAQVVHGRRVLLLDAALGVPTDNMKSRLRALEAMGFCPDLEENLFGGSLPPDMAGFFRNYWGVNEELVLHDIRNGVPADMDQYDAMLITGSPANVGSMDDNSLIAGQEYSHADVYSVVDQVHKAAFDLGMPVLGVCYGHHYLTRRHGGLVGKMPKGQVGMRSVALHDVAREVLTGMGIDSPLSGEAYVAHQEASLGFGAGSIPLGFAQSNDFDSTVNQFALHVGEDPVVEMANKIPADASFIIESMAKGRYVGFGMQAHSELAFPHLLLRSIHEGHSLENLLGILQRMAFTRSSLQYVARFLKLHKNFH